MRTDFSIAQLRDPGTAAAAAVIRKCVHCGFCTATCPTYVLLGDELDSPRGRIYLMKDMLENDRVPTSRVVKHIDRCLSCLSCMTTCPSDVNYMHLVDHARFYIERRYRRPLQERFMRSMLIAVLPYPQRFRAALRLASLFKPATGFMGKVDAFKPIAAMLGLTPRRLPTPVPVAASLVGHRRGRVAVLQGCAQSVLAPEVRAATVRLLNRMGFDVVVGPGEGCCGALAHHMGRESGSLDFARRNIDSWETCIADGGLDAVIVTASGCGTTIKDYGFMLRNDAQYADKAARIAAMAMDIVEFVDGAGLPEGRSDAALVVAYHSACSMQHGQRITTAPQRLLTAAGFTVKLPADAHLCCGSAGTYNILQPDIAGQLRDRKVACIERLAPDVIATGNIGCAIQIGTRSRLPILHTVELLDWATGGPPPPALSRAPP